MNKFMHDVAQVPEQISATADRLPESIALRNGCQELTYAELDRKAELFASRLVGLHVKPGDAVAICLDRSFEWIVTALGVMRAGAAYVPLDPAWPDSRMRFVIEDSAATLLVASTDLIDRLDLGLGSLDPKCDDTLTAACPKAARGAIDPQSLAYIIYTSGSTGTPKGVEITHANLSHLARWHRNAFKVTPADCASHLAGLGFDAAAWELWPNLCAGATICLAENAVRSSSTLLQQWLIGEGVTISFIPTVHASSMMKMHWPAATRLRFLLTGGEVLHEGPAKRLPFEVVNNYGPTECTVVSTSSSVPAGTCGRPTIGRPIAGATVYLLDERGEQVADGVSGEIYIGGDGVGRGYRNLPESTARSFVSDPFSTEPGKRLYRTGDRGIRRSDGEIEFCGRSDRQVKIRGQRVELDEIGTVLTRHPAIEFATVSFRAAEDGQSHLVAYILPKDGMRTVGAAELHKHLRDTLPDYMIPSVFMELKSLPLSPNAKVETARMEQAENMRPLDDAVESAAADATGRRLLAMFREVLKNPSISIDDNFFLAGGHSLLGMQLVTRLQSTFGVAFNAQEIFEAPTVRLLSPLVSTRMREQRVTLIWEDLLGRRGFGLDDDFFEQGGDPTLLPVLQERMMNEFGRQVTVSDFFENPSIRLQAELVRGDLKESPVLPPGVFALHPQGTRPNIFWLHNLLPAPLAKEVGPDQPFFFVTFTARDVALLGEAPSMKEIAACMLAKIVATQPTGPYIISGRCIGSVVAYEVASQLREAGEEVSLLMMMDAPTQPYLRSSKAFITRLKHPRFYLYRALHVAGQRKSLTDLLRRAMRHAPHSIQSRFRVVERLVAHRAIVRAAFDYYPPKYGGQALLLLAKERDPLFNFLPGWEKVIEKLDAFYVQGRHLDLITSKNVKEIATIIRNSLSQCSNTADNPVGVSSWTASA